MTKETGIIMSGNHPKLVLDGTKTQTRRVIKPQPKTDGLKGVYPDLYNHEPNKWAFWLPDNRMTEPRTWACPYGQVGDRLWVRETWATDKMFDKMSWAEIVATKVATIPKWYKVGDTQLDNPKTTQGRWRSSRFCPKEVSRITLEITDIRVERVQEISQLDIDREGVDYEFIPEARPRFKKLWDSINAKRGCWNSNPFVWVISFRRLI